MKIKMGYSENGGSIVNMEFKDGGDLIEWLSKLLTKKLKGSTIFVHSFSGPMLLGKMVYDYLSADLSEDML